MEKQGRFAKFNFRYGIEELDYVFTTEAILKALKYCKSDSTLPGSECLFNKYFRNSFDMLGLH